MTLIANVLHIACELTQMYKIHVERSYCSYCEVDDFCSRDKDYENARRHMITQLANVFTILTSEHVPYIKIHKVWVITLTNLPIGFSLEPNCGGEYYDELKSPVENVEVNDRQWCEEAEKSFLWKEIQVAKAQAKKKRAVEEKEKTKRKREEAERDREEEDKKLYLRLRDKFEGGVNEQGTT